MENDDILCWNNHETQLYRNYKGAILFQFYEMKYNLSFLKCSYSNAVIQMK